MKKKFCLILLFHCYALSLIGQDTLTYKEDPSFFSDRSDHKVTLPISIVSAQDADSLIFKIDGNHTDSVRLPIKKGKPTIITQELVATLMHKVPDKDFVLAFRSVHDATRHGKLSVTITKGSGGDDKLCVPLDGKYFIPGYSRAYFDNVTKPICNGCEAKLDYIIQYDLTKGPPVISYYKKVRKSCGGEQCDSCFMKISKNKCFYYKLQTRLRPAVGKNVGFDVFGYYPKFDSIRFESSFSSKHLEFREKFAKFITPNFSADTKQEPNADSTVVDEKPADAVAATGTAWKLDTLRNELREYLSTLLHFPKSQMELQFDIEYINGRISACFNISSFPAGMKAWEEKHLSGMSVASKRNAETVLAEAINYYQSILGYSYLNIPVVQVRNEDMLVYDFDYYKHGKQVTTSMHHALIRGGWKIDFSTGLVATGLYDKAYAMKAVDADSSEIIEKNIGKNMTLGATLLAHVYPRTGSRVNASITTGFVLDENAAINKYLVGGSLLLGYEQRFIVNYGFSIGQVERLSKGFELGKHYSNDQHQSLQTEVPTSDAWDVSWFFGVSYNLGGTKLGGN